MGANMGVFNHLKWVHEITVKRHLRIVQNSGQPVPSKVDTRPG